LEDGPFTVLTPEFWGAIEFVGEAIEDGGVVLVHCRRGISRSPALCIGYLMEKKGYTYEAALELVTKQRPVVMVNPGFAQQLEDRARQR
jgi:protein-tyrosine phosphatase